MDSIMYSYMNCPYMWGGRSPFGLDCSGFTQNVFMLFGKKLSRDACDQEKQGKIVDDIKNSKYGDLAFFENKDKKVTHVGIILDNNKIIHCSGRVRIDDLDNKGIIDTDTKDYSHILHSMKRIF
jgi:cell wall-associated NlpC family hydrolase